MSNLIQKQSYRNAVAQRVSYDQFRHEALPQKQSPFFKLPLEVMVLIFNLLFFYPADHVPGLVLIDSWERMSSGTNLIAFLKTCYLAYVNGIQTLYRINTFQFNVCSRPLRFLENLDPYALAALHTVILSPLYPNDQKTLQPVCEKLATSGIKRLQLEISWEDYKIFVPNQHDPSKWHPVTEIRGLQYVHITHLTLEVRMFVFLDMLKAYLLDPNIMRDASQAPTT